jgi:GT2 family glycosyltransferase
MRPDDTRRASAGTTLSVVIPTSRGGSDLETCLATLSEQHYPGLDVIVIDNGAPPDSVRPLSSEASFGSFRVLRNESNLGYAGACNQGLSAAAGDVVLLLNDDTALEAGSLAALLGALADHPSWGACQAKLLTMENPGLIDTAGSFLTPTGFLVHRGAWEPEEAFSESDEVFAAKGAALLLRRAALLDVGTFDPDFFAYFEETDLCWRLWLAGWKVGYAADARILHRLGATASSLPQDFVQFHSFKNRINTLIKNLGPARAAWMLPYHLALCLSISAWYVCRGRPRLGLSVLRAVGWNARNIRTTLGKRRAVQGRRAVSDGALMPLILRKASFGTLFGYAKRTT